MNGLTLAYFFTAIFALRVLAGAASVVGASLYDIRRINGGPQTGRLGVSSQKPAITLIVYTRNYQSSITECLRNISGSNYKNYQVIVVDDVSTDNTKKLVRQFIRRHKTRSIRLVSKRKPGGFESAVYGVRRYVTGDYVLALDGNTFIAKDTLKKSARALSYDKSVDLLVLNQTSRFSPSFRSLLGHYELSSRFYTYKSLFSVAACSFRIVGPGVILSRTSFEKFSKSKQRHLRHQIKAVYDAANTLFVEPSPTMPQKGRNAYSPAYSAQYTNPSWLSLRGYSASFIKTIYGFVDLVEPFMLAYFFYLAYTFQSSSLLVLSAVAFAVWFVMIILADNYLAPKAKLGYFLLLPTMYLLYFVNSVIKFISMAFRLLPRRQKSYGY